MTIEPQIDVEDVEAALELAAGGLGDTILRPRDPARARRARAAQALGWVPFAEPIYDTFAFITRRGAPLSPAAREFMALAEERSREHAEPAPPRAAPPPPLSLTVSVRAGSRAAAGSAASPSRAQPTPPRSSPGCGLREP